MTSRTTISEQPWRGFALVDVFRANRAARQHGDDPENSAGDDTGRAQFSPAFPARPVRYAPASAIHSQDTSHSFTPNADNP